MNPILGCKFHSVFRPARILVCQGRLQQTYAAVSSKKQVPPDPNDVTPVFKNASRYGEKIAIRDMHGDYTYRGLYLSARQFADRLSARLSGEKQQRVAFLMPNDASYVILQWACWMSGQIAVPLSTQHPPALLDYYIKDSDAKTVVTTTEFAPLLGKKVADPTLFDDASRILAMRKQDSKFGRFDIGDEEILDEFPEAGMKGDFYEKSDALFVYTSGTTSSPKGVVLTHKNLQAQANALIQSWKYNEKDIILHTLPLNHIHGIVNLLLCPLYVGARCVMLSKFETTSVWSQLLAVNLQNSERINVFMAVPTIYAKLIQEYDQLFSKNAKIREYVHTTCSTKIRLMVSGSAPLPKPVFDRWEEITGHRLLERYGMTETGMVLSNPLEGQRIPGSVGTPLPGVQVRITKTDKFGDGDDRVLVVGDSSSSKVSPDERVPVTGELQVKGDGVFTRYWNKPEATAKEFTKDGWFKTGDTARYENGIYKILGRTSVDIIKTGGYKVSALQVETVILGHPDVLDCTVVGLPDNTWGQKVAAVVVTRKGAQMILSQLREFAKKSLPEYAVPTVLRIVDKIPKNAMGKVNKPDLLKTMFSN